MTTIAKISVEKYDSQEQILYDFDKSKSLEDNIKDICEKTGIPESNVFGLKHNPTKNNLTNHYVSEDNYLNIKHNDCLKVVFSIKHILSYIETHIFDPALRDTVFQYIDRLGTDPVFIEELADSEGHIKLIDIFITENLEETEEELPLLITILHLFSKGRIKDTSQNILQKIFNILNNTDKPLETYNYSLSILQKILVSRNHVFDPWKEKIIQYLPLKDIVPYTWKHSNMDLQYSALLLINTLIRVCKGDRRLKLIKEMNQSKNRENIYNYIIVKGNLDRKMEHELYVLQTYLLSLFTEALHSGIPINNNSFFKKDDFELCPEDMRRITVLMDFEEDASPLNQFHSIENLVLNDGDRNSRISLASLKSNESIQTGSKGSSKYNSEYFDVDNATISHLTLEALKYYKASYYRNFHQSQIEEKLYEPGIYVTSEKIVKMLGKLLHIGVETPESKSTFYQPVVFFSSGRKPFFFELFSRTMWLLSQTRREMKASTITDYPKVMYILEKQIQIALETRPIDFQKLTDALSNISFQIVIEKIQNVKEANLIHMIEYHPCIKEMRQKFIVENEGVVYQQRINCLLAGLHFPKVQEKKAHGNIFVQLSKNMKDLLVYEMENVKKPAVYDSPKTFPVDDITHVVIGNNCQHSHLCDPKLAFSIIINHAEVVKFIGKDEKIAAYWSDALILLSKSNSKQ